MPTSGRSEHVLRPPGLFPTFGETPSLATSPGTRTAQVGPAFAYSAPAEPAAELEQLPQVRAVAGVRPRASGQDKPTGCRQI